MKNIIQLLISITFLTFTKLQAQNNLNHPTISNVTAQYRAIQQNTAQVNPNVFSIQVIPQATVTLVNNANASKIYLKIINQQTSQVVYQINYLIGSATVLDGNGNKLFENNAGAIFISPGQGIELKPYEYQVTTEDSQQNMTAIFSVIQ